MGPGSSPPPCGLTALSQAGAELGETPETLSPPWILPSPILVDTGVFRREIHMKLSSAQPRPPPAASIKSYAIGQERARFFQRMYVCIVGSSKHLGELRVTAQPDKWQEVQDLGLTFLHKGCTAQPGELGLGTDTATARHFLPFVGPMCSLPSAPAFLSCLTPVRYLWRGAPQYRNGWIRSPQQDVGRQTGRVPTTGGRIDELK